MYYNYHLTVHPVSTSTSRFFHGIPWCIFKRWLSLINDQYSMYCIFQGQGTCYNKITINYPKVSRIVGPSLPEGIVGTEDSRVLPGSSIEVEQEPRCIPLGFSYGEMPQHCCEIRRSAKLAALQIEHRHHKRESAWQNSYGRPRRGGQHLETSNT